MIPQQEGSEKSPSVGTQIQALSKNQTLPRAPSRTHSSRAKDKHEALERPPSASELIQAPPINQTLSQALARIRATRARDKQERAKSVEDETQQKTLKADIKQIDAAELSITRAYMGLINLVLLKLTSW